jgi:hypothetical protein
MSDKKRIDLQLRSNVKLCYDYCFSTRAEYAFLRMYHTPYLDARNVPRRDMFKSLESLGVETVPNGIVEELLARHDPAFGVVVYTDELAHMGNGKLWLSAKQALREYPKAWASLFIPPAGQAIRHFQFGSRSFTMPFQTFDDWRCQKGESTYSYCVPGSRYEHLFPEVFPYPYFAIDFIPGTDMATDFQLVPGMTGDRLENWMTPREMYRALQEAAWILLDRGLARGDQESGYGLVKVSDLVDEQEWLAAIGQHR